MTDIKNRTVFCYFILFDDMLILNKKGDYLAK